MKFTTTALIVCMFAFANVLHQSGAILKTTFLEDLCFNKNYATIQLKYETSGILMAVPRNVVNEDFSCDVTLMASSRGTVVLSIYRYEIGSKDHLIIEDSDRHKIGILGWGLFKDETKTIVSKGSITIRYKRSNETSYNPKTGFQFTFTQLSDPPCRTDEYQCKNNKQCIPKSLACDGHNHCGDNSDQIKCVPGVYDYKDDNKDNYTTRHTSTLAGTWIITIIIVAAVLGVVIIVFIVVAVRRAKLKKASNLNQQPQGNETGGGIPLNSVSSTVPSNNVQRVSPTDVHRSTASEQQLPQPFYRRSFRGQQTQRVENIPREQGSIPVPSMYPNLDQIPSAPVLSGEVNPNFQGDD